MSRSVAELSDTLNFPLRPADAKGGAIPFILWLLLLLTGALLVIARAPMRAPAFDTLTAFTCDRQPVFQSGWIRGQKSPSFYICKAGNEVLYQRTAIPVAGKYGAWLSCSRANGIITIWRHDNPSVYGPYIFQSTCGGEVYASYAVQSANYDAAQVTGGVIAWSLVIVSGCKVAVWCLHSLRRRKVKNGVSVA
jgi:hypothetical protein